MNAHPAVPRLERKDWMDRTSVPNYRNNYANLLSDIAKVRYNEMLILHPPLHCHVLRHPHVRPVHARVRGWPYDRQSDR